MAGLLLVAAGLPPLIWVLGSFRSDESMTSDVLAFQLFVGAMAGNPLLGFFSVDPLHAITLTDPLRLLARGIILNVAVRVGIIFDQSARRSRFAYQAAAECETVADIAKGVPRSVPNCQDALDAPVARLRGWLDMTSESAREQRSHLDGVGCRRSPARTGCRAACRRRQHHGGGVDLDAATNTHPDIIVIDLGIPELTPLA